MHLGGLSMKRVFNVPFFIAHVLAVILVRFVFLPGEREVSDNIPFLAAIVLIEALYMIQLIFRGAVQRKKNSISEIMIMVYGILLCWELGTTQYNRLNVLLFPSPENVFLVFKDNYKEMAINALYSLELLAVGFVGGIFLGTFVGILVGWVRKLREIFHPVFKVLAPIPPMIISPYVIVIMPTFRSASVILVMFTVFLFVILGTIETVTTIDRNILDSARALNLNAFTMMKDILLPYVMPGVVSQLKINMILGFMMLMFAETLGAKYGLGHWVHVNHMYMNYTGLIAGFIEIGVLVVIINRVIGEIQKKAIRWK